MGYCAKHGTYVESTVPSCHQCAWETMQNHALPALRTVEAERDALREEVARLKEERDEAQKKYEHEHALINYLHASAQAPEKAGIFDHRTADVLGLLAKLRARVAELEAALADVLDEHEKSSGLVSLMPSVATHIRSVLKGRGKGGDDAAD